MKKNYTLLASAILGGAMVASAAAPVLTGEIESQFTGSRALVKAEAMPAPAAKAQVKQQAGETDTWETLGTGTFTDFVFTTLDYPAQTLEVTFEKSTTTANRYRIVEPYAKWVDPKGQFPLTYDATKMTPIVFDVINDKYVYFHTFNTGYTLDDATGGEIGCEMNASAMVEGGATFEQIIA